MGFPGGSAGWEDPQEKGTATHFSIMGFPGGSDGKEPAYNTEGPGSIPELGSSPGEGIIYPLQYSWASLVAHMVKNRPETQET